MIKTKFAPPATAEYAEYYQQYINKFAPEDFLGAFESQISVMRDLLGALPDGEESRLHEPYTWTLKQLMGHLIDCERIFSTRLLRIAVSDETPIQSTGCFAPRPMSTNRRQSVLSWRLARRSAALTRE